MPVAVGIVEDDSGYAEGIRFLLDHSDEFRCVAVCPSAEEALVRLPPLRPQVVLMDIHLKAASGIECVGELKRLLPDTKVLMLTVFEDYERVYQSLKAGASGYLLKRSTPQELLNAIRELLAGGSPMSTAIARLVVDAFRQFAPPPGTNDPLSPREREVLSHLAAGRRYKEVALLLGVSYDTVRTHVQNIYKKLHVHSLEAAIPNLRPPR
jgi:DNA-binding NarL/FixJ family response regulator